MRFHHGMQTRLRRSRSRFVCAAVFAIGLTPLASAQDLAIERAMLPITVAGKAIRLETLIAKPAAAGGKLPIVLIVPAEAGASQPLDGQMPLARDFARRGWLSVVMMRRGEGRSEGQKPAPPTCQDQAFMQRLAAEADDLAATLAALGQRGDADATRSFVVGALGGGAGAVALSALAPSSLKAVMSLAGGLRVDNCGWQPNLVSAYRGLGRRSRVPNMWVYAENDTVFDPNLVEQMHAAFLDAGGDVQFMALAAVGRDGQALFTDPAGRRDWLREMDAFLRAHSLPTWTRADINGVLKKLGYTTDALHSEALNALANYYSAAGEKALARSTGAAFIGRRPTLQLAAGRPTLDIARRDAIALCEKIAAPCVIVMENFTWVGDEP